MNDPAPRRRRIFLSMLGTSAYDPVVYKPISELEPRSRRRQKFVQLARLLALESLHGPLEGAFFFVTPDAFNRNWRDGGQKDPDGVDLADKQYRKEKAWVGLESSAKREGVRTPITPIPINNGQDVAELWKTFAKISDTVNYRDILHVDVTHGFRTLPMVLLWTLDYVRRVKGAEIVEVSYGAYEAKPPNGKSSRPTWDLRPFLDLQDWTDAYHQLMARGDFEPFGLQGERFVKEFVGRAELPIPTELTGAEKARLGKENSARRKQAKALVDATGLPAAASELRQLGDDLERVRLQTIPTTAHRACEALQKAAKQAHAEPEGIYLQPLRLVLERVRNSILPMAASAGSSSLERIRAEVAAATFLLRHHRHMQSFTLFREAMVDLLEHLCQVEMPRTDLDKIPGALSTFFRNEKERRDGWTALQDKAFDLLRVDPRAKAVSDVLVRLTDPRNVLDHAHTSKELKTENLRDAGEKVVKEATAVLGAVVRGDR